MYLDNKLSVKQAGPIIKRCFPGYGGRRIYYDAVKSVTLSGTYWDGGSRSSYVGFNLANGAVGHPSLNLAPPQFGGLPEPLEVPLDAELAIVKYQRSGNYDYIVIYVHPDAVPKLLENPPQ